MVQGFNHHGFGNENNMQMFLLLMLLFPGMFGGMNNNMLPLMLIMMSS